MIEQMYSSYFNYFTHLDWQTVSSFDFGENFDSEWLQEQGSLSQRFSLQCQHLSAQVVRNQILPISQLTHFQRDMLLTAESDDQDYLLREVILSADDEPWLLGSTLIPRSSLTDEQFDLSKQGEKPLGLTVFQAQQVARDQLHLGTVSSPLGELAARSSRLWMNQNRCWLLNYFCRHRLFIARNE